MADLNYIDRDAEIKIVGQDSTGDSLNYVSADVNGNMFVKDYSDGPVTPGSAASVSSLIGGQFNTALPTLTTTQQSAIQRDSSGRLIIRPLTSSDVISAVQSGTWTVQQGTPPWSVVGTLTYNNSSPLANNIGVLPAIAENVVNPSRYTSNAQVLLVTDIAGNTNVDLQYYMGSAVSATNPIVFTLSDGLNTLNRSISAYGTAPVGTAVQGVNAYITNNPEISAIYNSTPPTLSNGQQSPLQLDMNGNLKISGTISAVNFSVSGTGFSFPAYATYVGGAVTTSSPTYNTGNLGALSLTTAGALRIDGSGVTQPVSQVGGPWTQNLTEIGGSAIALGQTTMSASIPVTIASNQSALSVTQGTSPWVVSQSSTPWLTSDAADGSVAGGTAGTKSMLAGGVYNSTLPTLTNGQQASLQLDSAGYLLIAPPLDVFPATQNITVIDSASTTVTGVNGQNFITGTPTAGSASNFTLASEYSVVVQVTGTWTGTLQIEISMDGGTTWSPNPVNQDGTNYILNAFSGNFTGRANTAGYTNFRVRAIAAMTGTAVVKISETVGLNTVYINNAIKITDNSGDVAVISSTGSIHVLSTTAGPVTPGTVAKFRSYWWPI